MRHFSPSPDPWTGADDEYAKVGTYDPKVVVTTSRDPSSRLLLFSKVCDTDIRLIGARQPASS
jgi:hypothetical protein